MRWFYPSALCLLALSVSQACVAEDAGHWAAPKNCNVKVTFMLSEGVTVGKITVSRRCVARLCLRSKAPIRPSCAS
jgi:hypothetical protein